MVNQAVGEAHICNNGLGRKSAVRERRVDGQDALAWLRLHKKAELDLLDKEKQSSGDFSKNSK
jgi:hypothetical protein